MKQRPRPHLWTAWTLQALLLAVAAVPLIAAILDGSMLSNRDVNLLTIFQIFFGGVVAVSWILTVKSLSKKPGVNYWEIWNDWGAYYEWRKFEFGLYWILSGFIVSLPLKSYIIFSDPIDNIYFFLLIFACYVIAFGSLMGKVGLISADVAHAILQPNSFDDSLPKESRNKTH